VLDIFAGSNTTGSVCEQEGRYWLAFEENREYLAASAFRFLEKKYSKDELENIYQRILYGEQPVLKMLKRCL
jgi:site-specific DNA-methyltransferase (cytosine-N4-specific)